MSSLNVVNLILILFVCTNVQPWSINKARTVEYASKYHLPETPTEEAMSHRLDMVKWAAKDICDGMLNETMSKKVDKCEEKVPRKVVNLTSTCINQLYGTNKTKPIVCYFAEDAENFRSCLDGISRNRKSEARELEHKKFNLTFQLNYKRIFAETDYYTDYYFFYYFSCMLRAVNKR